MRTALLVSLRANPAFIQHMLAYAKAFRELGFNPAFLVDPAYGPVSDLRQAGPCLDSLDSALAAKPSHAVFFNPALTNIRAAKALKQIGTRVIYLYHEPWQMSLQYLRDEGLLDTCKAILAHRFTIPMLRTADRVLVGSRYALGVYHSSDVRFNPRVSFLPLLYDDDAASSTHALIGEKKYFSFIGNPCRAHGFDQFLKVMRTAFMRRMEINFLIASRFSLPESVLHDATFTRNRSRIEIRCGRPLSNQEINSCYKQSLCVWNVYRRSTQSGVLPKALMFGAPLVCSGVGSFPEYLASGQVARVVSGDDADGVLKAFQQLRDNLAMHVEECRRVFLNTFYYRANLDEFADLFQQRSLPHERAVESDLTPGSEYR